MPKITLSPFASPPVLEAMSKIIRLHSSNKGEVRETILRNVDLSRVRSVLDLGCGFGFMAEALASRCAPDALVMGIDAFGANREPFLKRVRAAGRRAVFSHHAIAAEIPASGQSFDLVICSYSLYFFSEVLPDIARVLRPEGMLIAVTHCESAFRGLFLAAGLAHAESTLLSIIKRFSAENASSGLSKYFGEITRIDYPNELRFDAGAFGELLDYVKFKLPYMIPEALSGAVPDGVARSLQAWMEERGEVIVEKDDVCFIARRPRCP